LFGRIKSYFLKNNVILPSFSGHKNGPSHQELKKGKVSEEKKRKNLAVLTKTPFTEMFCFQQSF